MNEWYAQLHKPPLTPPDWIFAPVWTVLYALILVSIILYFRAPSRPRWVLTTCVLVVHLASNFAWTYVFFSLKSPLLALGDIVLLDLTLLLLIPLFRRASRLSGLLLCPYLLWVLFATYLNLGIYWLN